METIAAVAQLVAIISASWAIVSGVGAWKREFIGKRKIELAELVLAKFFEVRDAVSFIRNPFSNTSEGNTRERREGETKEESELLDNGYIVFERFHKREQCFVDFSTLKYRFMASFGHDAGGAFGEVTKIVNSIFVSARMLSTHYWQRQGRVAMTADEFKKHLEEMHRHEARYWEISPDGEINKQLSEVQIFLEQVTAPCFQEPVSWSQQVLRNVKLWANKSFKRTREKPRAA
ncbi:MAG: hypothetical protein ACRD22_05060 [Terriglobia bacterium]